MTQATIKLDARWKAALQDQFDAPYMASLKSFLAAEKSQGKEIFPKLSLIHI